MMNGLWKFIMAFLPLSQSMIGVAFLQVGHLLKHGSASVSLQHYIDDRLIVAAARRAGSVPEEACLWAYTAPRRFAYHLPAHWRFEMHL